MIPGQGTEIPKAVQGGRKRKTYELKSDAGKKLNTHTHPLYRGERMTKPMDFNFCRLSVNLKFEIKTKPKCILK